MSAGTCAGVGSGSDVVTGVLGSRSSHDCRARPDARGIGIREGAFSMTTTTEQNKAVIQRFIGRMEQPSA
jgi:hypothetical protein